MCGIAALYSYDDRGVAAGSGELRAASEWMKCRGPDGSGEWTSSDRRASLAHRRLAIIDLSDAGAQPMQTEGGALVISFNGEIYNYRELRARLESKGYRFRTAPTPRCCCISTRTRARRWSAELRGMFAFALWDERRKGLLLARDHFGIKPLYYADDGRTIRAASEVKALLAGGSIDTTPDQIAHHEFFVWGHVPEPRTMYRGIRSLPAGVDDVDRSRRRARPAHVRGARANAGGVGCGARDRWMSGERAERLRAAMLDSVKHHLVADVDVGVFLSAGIDSTVLAALAAEAGGRLRTVTLGFAEYRGTAQDETPVAEAVAKQLGAEHSTIWVTRADFKGALEHLLERMDQPSIDGVNSYFVTLRRRRRGSRSPSPGSAAMSCSADMRTSSTSRASRRWWGVCRRAMRLGKIVRKAVAPLLAPFASTKYASVIEYGGDYAGAYLLRRAVFLPWEVRQILTENGETSDHEIEIMRELINGALTRALPSVKVSVLEAQVVHAQSAFARCRLGFDDAFGGGAGAARRLDVVARGFSAWARVAVCRQAGAVGDAENAVAPRGDGTKEDRFHGTGAWMDDGWGRCAVRWSRPSRVGKIRVRTDG